MDLYIATGISYLFTVLCLKVNENSGEPGDLIIIDAFPHAAEYGRRLEALQLFRSIAVVPKATFVAWNDLCRPPRTRLGRYPAFAKELVIHHYPALWLTRYRHYPFYRQVYTRMFTSGVTVAFLPLQLSLHQRHGCKVYLFDSGIGTRIPRPNWPMANHEKLLRRFGATVGKDQVEGRYYFETTGTDLFYGKPIQQILPSAKNPELARVITHCFDYNPENDTLFSHDVIFMQQCFDAHETLLPLVQRQRELWQLIADRIPDAVLCPHPRTQEQYDPARTVKNSAGLASYDVSCMFCDSMEDKVLITCFSYSPLVPKHMFGKEPYVVFLYKLLGVAEVAGLSMDRWDALMRDAVKACYRDPGKVMIPANEQELGECLRRIGERTAGRP